MKFSHDTAPQSECHDAIAQVAQGNIEAVSRVKKEEMTALALLVPKKLEARNGLARELRGPLDAQNRAMLNQVYHAIGARLGETTAIIQDGDPSYVAEQVYIPVAETTYIMESTEYEVSEQSRTAVRTFVLYFGS